MEGERCLHFRFSGRISSRYCAPDRKSKSYRTKLALPSWGRAGAGGVKAMEPGSGVPPPQPFPTRREGKVHSPLGLSSTSPLQQGGRFDRICERLFIPVISPRPGRRYGLRRDLLLVRIAAGNVAAGSLPLAGSATRRR